MQELFFDLPLYKKITISDSEDDKIEGLLQFLNYNDLIDGYNPELGENTSYKVTRPKDIYQFDIDKYVGKIERNLVCVRTQYVITYYFLLDKKEFHEVEEVHYFFRKIGQFPTIADLEIGKHKKYSKVISKELLREFNKAIGLSANGVGIGSFVYLRRIFEALIEQYHQQANKEPNWDEEGYSKARILEKIDKLKSYLPDAIVKYMHVYSILSKGIHELDEQECLTYFPIVKDAIISILEQDYLAKENKQKQKELENSIKSLVNKLK